MFAGFLPADRAAIVERLDGADFILVLGPRCSPTTSRALAHISQAAHISFNSPMTRRRRHALPGRHLDRHASQARRRSIAGGPGRGESVGKQRKPPRIPPRAPVIPAERLSRSAICCSRSLRFGQADSIWSKKPPAAAAPCMTICRSSMRTAFSRAPVAASATVCQRRWVLRWQTRSKVIASAWRRLGHVCHPGVMDRSAATHADCIHHRQQRQPIARWKNSAGTSTFRLCRELHCRIWIFCALASGHGVRLVAEWITPTTSTLRCAPSLPPTCPFLLEVWSSDERPHGIMPVPADAGAVKLAEQLARSRRRARSALRSRAFRTWYPYRRRAPRSAR